eukprot:CAMPEP_0169221366 /NCGR_PEP_ID=MMETSP1016-20121227/21009_1 /TAXON_ID=342587 /ORGANISM="Karlodinium micrum, Strain CCMP2283" /LENGTH=225 /DNA_ID=CAMNT_0009299567 /DNA_START=39 /DNA_END=716 /DNA_ORIENTATION=-
MEPNFNAHSTEYGRLSETGRRREQRSCVLSNTDGRLSSGGSQATWNFTGKSFSDGLSNREAELTGKGCGIFPRVHPPDDPRISEVPIRSRRCLSFATTALAQQGGITPRQRVVDDSISRMKREATIWHEHDHSRSSALTKKVRSLRVAGVNSARLGHINTHLGHRNAGIEDRPSWMREDEHLPGGFLFTPSDPFSQLPEGTPGRGDPSRFGRVGHFSSSFPPRQG